MPWLYFPGTQTFRILPLWLRLVLVVVCLASCAALGSHAWYERDHDLPNPYWSFLSDQYTYTPDAGPPGPGLLDVRPDVLVQRYISDYMRIAGTFPCSQDLASYHYPDWHGDDPVLGGHTCAVRRPVDRVSLLSVHVSGVMSHSGDDTSHRNNTVWEFVDATVSYSILYQDGEQWSNTFDLSTTPDNAQPYYGFLIHVGCWLSLDISHFYAVYEIPAPTGVAHDLKQWGDAIICAH